MKLKASLNKCYDCKRINKYKEENYKYIMIISKHNGQGKIIYFDVKYNYTDQKEKLDKT